jgi:hypothetical protein
MYPFYRKARDLWTETQVNQIIKGLEKYPEPFTPTHWSAGELLTHALEESVDLTHYLVGLKEVDEAKDTLIEQLKDENARLKERLALFQEEPLPLLTDARAPYSDLDD